MMTETDQTSTALEPEHHRIANDRKGPFYLGNEDAYQAWRAEKLDNYPSRIEDLMVPIATPEDPTNAERAVVLQNCRKANMAIYQCGSHDIAPELVQATAQCFGLSRVEDHRSAGYQGLVSIEVATTGRRDGFIPYTDKPLSWHTDGYYNDPRRRVRAMVMHCARDAAEGGENRFFDHEIAYIRLRDENPAFITALLHRRAMTVPSFLEDDGGVRPERTGAVFLVERFTGALHMRFTARKTNIVWRDTPDTHNAVDFLLNEVLVNDPRVFSYRLKPGEGIICNNILHNRTGFTDRQSSAGDKTTRLVYRGRYMDRVADIISGEIT